MNPTLQTIADQAGVSRAAVSLALRNQPGISKSTRERIKTIANELGYRPNPMVSALMSHLKTLRPTANVGAIPFITDFPTRDEWRDFSIIMRYFEGASARAQQAGYHLEEMWLREPGMTAKKMRSILVNRGVEGVLIAPLPEGRRHISLDMSNFAGATMGYSLVRPKLHRAVHRHIESLRLVLQKLRHLGYRRIGLAVYETQDRRNDFNWSTAYAGYQITLPAKERIPIFYLDGDVDSKFSKWLKIAKPDAILSGNVGILDTIHNAGLSVPEDVGVAILDHSESDKGVAGIDQQPELVGAAAVDMIVAQINRNERGLPVSPRQISTEGIWIPGKSVRRV
jgi:DNA-binding LacI/PurR family transcriptional regulator